MKKIKFKKHIQDNKTGKTFFQESEGYLYETGGLQFGIEKNKSGFWHETEITTGRSIRGDSFRTIAEVKAQCDELAPTAKKLLPKFPKISEKSKPKQENKPMKNKKKENNYGLMPQDKDASAGIYDDPKTPIKRKPKICTTNEKIAAKEQATKHIRPNPFSGADDTYLTPKKIAVTRTKHSSSKRGHKSVTQTKYYEQNESNMRQLAAVTDTVRIGRKGNRGFKRLR